MLGARLRQRVDVVILVLHSDWSTAIAYILVGLDFRACLGPLVILFFLLGVDLGFQASGLLSEAVQLTLSSVQSSLPIVLLKILKHEGHLWGVSEGRAYVVGGLLVENFEHHGLEDGVDRLEQPLLVVLARVACARAFGLPT